MTLLEALKSGQPFKRSKSKEWLNTSEQPLQGFTAEDVLADDYELFDDSHFSEVFVLSGKQIIEAISAFRGTPVNLNSSFASLILSHLKNIKNNLSTDLKLL